MSLIAELLKYEGVPPVTLTNMDIWQNPPLSRAAEKLIGFVPRSDDLRWGIIEPLAQVHKGVRDAALLATYASERPSK